MTEPLTYYTESGPLGQAIAALREKQGLAFDTIGSVGLGAGTAATYAEPHQKWIYYEIDPVVQEIAENPQYFTYLRDSRAPYEIVIGDGRLQIKAAPDSSFDLLILDAYSSDALPVHLLTREALELYASKLAPDGAMIFHISNRHLDLEPQMAALAKAIGWQALQFSDYNIDTKTAGLGKSASQWVMLTRRQSQFGNLNLDDRWTPLQEGPNMRVWTDSYSSLLSVFKWR
jgi:spermidine synthase